MVRFVLVLLCLTTSIAIHSQNTFHPYIHNYDIPLEYKHQKINSISRLSDQTMVFATQKGLLAYDGSDWQMLTVPEQPRVLHFDSYSGLLFAGCDKTIGIVKKKTDGNIDFHSIEDSSTTEPILAIQSVAQNIYYMRSSEVSCWDTKEKRVVRTWKSESSHYESLFWFNDKIYVTVSSKGIFELQDTGIKSVFSGIFEATAFSYTNGETLILGDKTGNVLSFDGDMMSRYDLEAKNYIMSNRISTGIPVGKEYCAIGTKNAGIVFINNKTGKIQRMANYQTGLADDDIRCLYLDSNNGLWIGHSEGISRADMQLNITDFTVYPGLSGTVQTSLISNNTLYVGTSEGVFYLSSVANYAEIEPFLRRSDASSNLQSVVMMRKVSKIVRVSFKNKSGKGSVTKDIPVEIEVPVDSIISSAPNKFDSDTIRKQYGIKSYPLHFKKISGINAKCMHLCPAGGKILVGTNNGLFEISDKIAYQLMEQVSISYIQPSIQDNYFALSNAGLLSFTLAPTFEILSMNEKLTNVSSIDFHSNTLWLTSGDSLTKIDVSKGHYLSNDQSFHLTNYFPEDNLISVINEIPTLFTYSSAYTFSDEKSIVEESEQLAEYASAVQRPLTRQQAYFWVKGADQWVNLKSSQPVPSQTVLFNIFNYITDIQADVKNNYWVIGDNRLYKIHGDLPAHDSTKGISINSIVSRTPFTIDGGILEIDSKNQGLEIRYSTKSYLAESKALYRFRLLGLNDDWTEWSKLTAIKYPFIPGGSYIFQLECKNVFGQVSHAEPLVMNVRIPIWERWWFYLSAGLLIIGGLVFVFSGRTTVAGVQEA